MWTIIDASWAPLRNISLSSFPTNVQCNSNEVTDLANERLIYWSDETTCKLLESYAWEQLPCWKLQSSSKANYCAEENIVPKIHDDFHTSFNHVMWFSIIKREIFTNPYTSAFVFYSADWVIFKIISTCPFFSIYDKLIYDQKVKYSFLSLNKTPPNKK